MRLLNKLFDYVLITTKYFNIDESHGVSHSMEVLNFTYKIFSGLMSSMYIFKARKLFP